VAQSLFSRRLNYPSDDAVRQGNSPNEGTIGPNPESRITPDSFKRGWVSKLNRSPRAQTFYQETFPADTADLAQKKINQASRTGFSTFANPDDNRFADDFLLKYSEAVRRGIIEEDRAVFPENLQFLSSEPAAAGSNEKSKETAGKFPSQGVM
jgi:hypothetical protein